MIKSFFRRYNLFFVNLVSASGLLASSDLLVQVAYEKRKDLDKKRISKYFNFDNFSSLNILCLY